MIGGVKMWCPYYKDGEYKCDLCNNSVQAPEVYRRFH